MIAALKRWIKNVKWLLNHPQIEVLGIPKFIKSQYNIQLLPNIKWEEFKAGNETTKKSDKAKKEKKK